MNTTMHLSYTLGALFVAAFLGSAPAWAGPGHDHGDEVPATVGQALPRFSAESEAFELVGVLRGKQITLYLDRFVDNSPVRGAQIELEIGAAKFKAEPLGLDEYTVVLPEAPKPGVLPVTAMLTADKDTDLLAGELDIHEEAHTDAAAHAHGWTEFAGWAAAGIAVGGVLVALLAWGSRRVVNARSVRAGGAA